VRLLDLFCGAGGAAWGYHKAGFEVVGVDTVDQPRYPFKFVHGNALTFDLAGFDAVHASPPCQRYSAGAGQMGTRHKHPDLISAARDRLRAAQVPYVIENIELARPELIFPVMLCGTMFSLGVFRHRLFECSWKVRPPVHPRHRGRVGDGKYVTVTGHAGGRSARDGQAFGTTTQWRTAMGIDWMTGRELAQAIPPAYTRYLGELLISSLPGRPARP
jgi:DNA (cytosine-5)-methyltransferase 1